MTESQIGQSGRRQQERLFRFRLAAQFCTTKVVINQLDVLTRNGTRRYANGQ